MLNREYLEKRPLAAGSADQHPLDSAVVLT